MSALVRANIKVGSNVMKTANMTVERVIRSAVVTPVVKLNGSVVSEIKVMSEQPYMIQLSSFSGLIAGDVLRAIVQSSGDISDGSQFMELSPIQFINGTECAWTFSIPADWNGIAIISILHVNYENKTIGYRYYALK